MSRVTSDPRCKNTPNKGYNMKKDVRHKILVMDDTKMVRDVMAHALQHLGYQVDCAEEGGEAIELYRSHMDAGTPFDAVILDLQIHNGMDGKTTMETLLVMDPLVKALAASGNHIDPMIAEFQNYGFKGVLVKPCRIGDIKEAVRRVLEEED